MGAVARLTGRAGKAEQAETSHGISWDWLLAASRTRDGDGGVMAEALFSLSPLLGESLVSHAGFPLVVRLWDGGTARVTSGGPRGATVSGPWRGEWEKCEASEWKRTGGGGKVKWREIRPGTGRCTRVWSG